VFCPTAWHRPSSTNDRSLFGHRLLGYFDIHGDLDLDKGAGTTGIHLAYPKDSVIQLKPGQYSMVVSATGFFDTSSSFGVANDDVDVRTCLTLAPIEGTTRPTSDLTVTTANNSQQKDVWIRLIGLFSGDDATAQASSEGTFEFRKLRPGRYLILLFDQTGLRRQKEIDVRGRTTKVKVEDQ
jgi:hypothetical protein